MQDPEKLREIESLGQEDEEQEEQEAYWDEAEEGQGGGGVPILQAVICAIALIVLLFFKFTDREKYQEIAEWYGQEMAQEIELPHLEKAVPEPSESPAPESAPVETPSPIQIDSAPPQML